MITILHIETATKVCSVALSRNGELVASKAIADDSFAHGEQLTLLIQSLMKETSCEMSELSAVSVASGPGSYTGLRIGVSTAKGLCYTLGIPLIGISALESLAHLARKKHTGINLVPMIDARRMEVYTAVYGTHDEIKHPVSAVVLEETTFAEFEPFVLIGDGAAKAAELWKERNCTFDPAIVSGAEGQVACAFWNFLTKNFEDVAYFEPAYLKEFQGTTPKAR